MLTRLQPIDNPKSKPLLKSPKLLVSLPENAVYAKFNMLPRTIKIIPTFKFFINEPRFLSLRLPF